MQCGCALKGFISSKILHLCFYSLGHQFHMLDLLQLQEPALNYICYRNLANVRFSWPDGCRKLIFKSCSTIHSLTTPIYHFSSYLHATYLFRHKDSVVILPKHASPVMLNEPASASSSVVLLYALELTGLKKWYNFLFLVQSDPRQIFFFSTQVKQLLSFFQLKYNKTVCRGCLSYKKPA